MDDENDVAREIDGRKGWQYVAAAIAYLHYRSGRDWRPASHRFHPEVEYSVSGINRLTQLKTSSAKSCVCVYCAGTPFYGEKKPVASVKVLAKKAGVA